MNFTELLRSSVNQNASDVHFSSGEPVRVRLNGQLTILEDKVWQSQDLAVLSQSLFSQEQQRQLVEQKELDTIYHQAELGRFRVNAFYQQRGLSIVLRCIADSIPKLCQLNAPSAIAQMTRAQQGLILVTGPTGSGKSTTLAAMVDDINRTQQKHIITIEDPIEFIHHSQQSLISQRQLQRDTLGFTAALRAALREDPDVILVGELRDKRSIQLALTAAETGHLVLATLHTRSACQAVTRIVDVFDHEEKSMIRVQLSESLKGVVAQRLLNSTQQKRVACYEVLMATSAIRNLIREGKVNQMYSMMQTGRECGMQTLEQSVAQHIEQGILPPEALKALDCD